MADDSFFREVNEDLRSDRMRSVWGRFGALIISVAVLIVLGTAAWRGYEYWQASVASESGDAFLEATNLARDGQTDEALAALEALRVEGHGAYPVLARMRSATLKAEAGDNAGAIADFTALGNDDSAPVAIRDAARLRAAYLLVDHGGYDEVQAVVTTLTGETNPMRHAARETLGLAAWKEGDMAQAEEWFSLIVADEQSPGGPVQRAEIMLDLITAAGPAETPAAEAPAAETPAAETPAETPITETPAEPATETTPETDADAAPASGADPS